MTIKEALKALQEPEMVPGGLLENLRTIQIEGMKIFPNADYPLESIEYAASTFKREGRKIIIERNFNLILHVIDTNVSAAEELRDNLVLNEQANPMSGIVAVMMNNPSLTVGSVLYDIALGDIEVQVGPDVSNRTTAAAMIPVRLRTWGDVPQ